MCTPASPHKGSSIVIPAHNACVFGMETPLRERSGGHAGTAPTASFGLIARERLISYAGLRVGRLVSFEWIARKWLFCLCGIAWKNMMETGRGGAYVPMTKFRINRMARMRSVMLSRLYCAVQSFKMT